MVNTHILPARGKRKAADIRPSDVDKRLAEVAKGRQKRAKPLQGARPTPLRANRTASISLPDASTMARKSRHISARSTIPLEAQGVSQRFLEDEIPF